LIEWKFCINITAGASFPKLCIFRSSRAYSIYMDRRTWLDRLGQ